MPPPLVDDLVEEVLLRFPPEDPAGLVRAALVCKRWRRLVSGPGFRRRFREFHRAPPMLGILCSGGSHVYRQLVPTNGTFRPRRHAKHAHYRVVDARHGRVLLVGERKALVVWDPVTDEEWKVRFPRLPPQYEEPCPWAAAVLCSAAGCDHLDCHRRPFIVFFLRTVFQAPTVVVGTMIWTYSSDPAGWSEPSFSQQPGHLFNPLVRSALVGNTLYFGTLSRTAFKYNLQLRQMSLIQLPSSAARYRQTLHTTEDGGLGLATLHLSKLYVWSMKDATWEQSRAIELKVLLPVDADFASLDVVGSADGLGIIFVRAGIVVYAVDLKNYKAKKVCEGEIYSIIPYMSFYTPDLEAAYAGEGPSEGGSSA